MHKQTPRQRDLKSIAANVARLSKLLTRERENLPLEYLKDPGLREAYVEYFLPANILKIQKPLEELSLHPARLLGKKLRVLDIGTGPGTAVLGVLDFFSKRTEGSPSLSFTAVDHVPENLQMTETLFKAYCSGRGVKASITTVRMNIEKLDHLDGRYDLIILSNVLNELFMHDEKQDSKRAALITKLLSQNLDPQGSCIIIEPALRETSRGLLKLRVALIEAGLHIFSPCIANSACEALQNPKDWCHEDVSWEPPVKISEIDKLTGLRKDSLKFSYLVVRHDVLSLADVCGQDAFRVVSQPLVSKGKIEYYVCGAQGRRLVMRLDKDRTEANKSFDVLKRGSIVLMAGLLDEEKRFKVSKETIIRLPLETAL